MERLRQLLKSTSRKGGKAWGVERLATLEKSGGTGSPSTRRRMEGAVVGRQKCYLSARGLCGSSSVEHGKGGQLDGQEGKVEVAGKWREVAGSTSFRAVISYAGWKKRSGRDGAPPRELRGHWSVRFNHLKCWIVTGSWGG